MELQHGRFANLPLNHRQLMQEIDDQPRCDCIAHLAKAVGVELLGKRSGLRTILSTTRSGRLIRTCGQCNARDIDVIVRAAQRWENQSKGAYLTNARGRAEVFPSVDRA